MSTILSPALLAAIPLIGFMLLLLILRWPVGRASVVGMLLIAMVAYWQFNLTTDTAIGSVVKAALLTLDIALILLGAITFFRVMTLSGILQKLQDQLTSLTGDHRMQAILIAWLLGGFLEGVAGFGIPALVVAPLLTAIGFPVYRAIIMALVANSTAVTFGAVGTPIRVGFEGLDVTGVAETAAAINVFAGLLIPLILLAMTITLKKEQRWQSFLEALPWALWAGISFTLPVWVFAQFSPELATLLGAATGLVIVSITTRYRFLVPMQQWQMENSRTYKEECQNTPVPFYLPFVLLILLLIGGKWMLENLFWNLGLPGGLHYQWKAFNPGYFFFATLVFMGIWRKALRKQVVEATRESVLKMGRPVLTIFSLIAFAQLFINAKLLHTVGSALDPALLHLYAPFLGAFGSFLTGSATVSNLLIGPLLTNLSVGTTPALLALLLIGAAAGNMIALQNILTISAAMDSKTKESTILAAVILPCLAYLVLAIVMSLLVA